MDFKDLKLELINKNKKFIDLVRIDGRSWQYLHKACSEGNENVLNHLMNILKSM